MEELINVGERIGAYIKYKGLGINQLGRLTNTSGTQVANIIKGKKFGLDKVYTLIKVLPDLSAHWLLFGEGEMLKSDNNSQATALDVLTQESEILKKEIQHLQNQISYQNLAIEAYRKSFDIATKANEELAEVKEFYKTHPNRN